jgi:hypothetical protein
LARAPKIDDDGRVGQMMVLESGEATMNACSTSLYKCALESLEWLKGLWDQGIRHEGGRPENGTAAIASGWFRLFLAG